MGLSTVLVAATANAVFLVAAINVLPRFAVFDDASDRSSHQGRAIRGLGVASVGAWLVAIPLFDPSVPLVPLLIAPIAAAIVGFADDVAAGVPATLRLGSMAVIGGVVAAELTDFAGVEPVRWLPLGLIWILYFTNAFNFMDGIDGISASTVVIAGVAYAVIGERTNIDAQIELAVTLAALGAVFGVVNILGSGRFLGDAGSYFFGAALGALALVTYFMTVSQAAAAGPLVIYVADTAVAIIRRSIRRESVFRAHRTHVYQRLVDDCGWSHAQTCWLVAGATALCSAIGVATTGDGAVSQAVAIPMLVAVALAYLAAPAVVGALGGRRSDLVRG